MLGDLADYQQYKTGRRLEGHIQNFIMVIPVLMSFVFMLCGWVWQQDIGFEPSKYTDIEVVPHMIVILMFYPLSKKKVEEVTAALRGASVNADEMGEGALNFMAEMRGESDAVEIVDGEGNSDGAPDADSGADTSASAPDVERAPESEDESGGGTSDRQEDKEG